MVEINKLVRSNIARLKPYSSARDEYSGEDAVFLDANENPFPTDYNRYPDPLQRELKAKIAELKGVNPDQIFLGNGSDEPIDLLYRVFCNPGLDNVIIPYPTYGMYEVCADINDVSIRWISLTCDFQLDMAGIKGRIDQNSKMIFLCSPNNPASISLNREDILELLSFFPGLVILDEAYIDFSLKESFLSELNKYPNLVILQTFSKAWGLAGIRMGMAFADARIISLLTKVKYPYNINRLSQKVALDTLTSSARMKKNVLKILKERDRLTCELESIPIVLNIIKGDANFVMAKFYEPRKIYDYLIDRKVVVRDRSAVHILSGYLRFTVGTPEENDLVIKYLKEIDQQK